jgi:hypothetical protein
MHTIIEIALGVQYNPNQIFGHYTLDQIFGHWIPWFGGTYCGNSRLRTPAR